MHTDTELWWRNCFLYVNELIEENEYNIVFDIGATVKRKLDPIKWMDLKFGTLFPWRLLVVGDVTQGAKEYRQGSKTAVASYPVWSAKEETIDALFELVSTGDHAYIIATDFPSMTLGNSRFFLTQVSNLQDEYPKTKIHIHGLYGFDQLFGNSFLSVDFAPRDDAAHGKIFLANGRKVECDKIEPHDVANLALCGMRAADLKEPRNRCLFNIRAARRAAYSYKDEKRYSTAAKDFVDLDIYSSNEEFRTVTNNRIFLRNNLKVQGGDKFHCDTCTLALDCKLYRKGAICTVPGSDAADLAKYFNTRNSDVILDGLGKVIQMQTERIAESMDDEKITGKKDKEINKDLKAVFDQGVKLAKLIDPSLRGTSQTNVQVNLGAGGSDMPTPKQLITGAIKELELRGIPRESITPEMIQGLLEGMIDPDNQRRAIEGTVIAGEVGF